MFTESSELTSLNLKSAIANIQGGSYRDTAALFSRKAAITFIFVIIAAYLFLLYRDSCVWLLSREKKNKSSSSKSVSVSAPSKSVSVSVSVPKK